MELTESLEAVKQAKRNYYLQCYEFAKNFIKNVETFTNEDITDEYEKLPNYQPSEKRVWGAVINELKKNGLIEFHSFVKFRGSQGHSRPVYKWKVK